MDGTGFGLSIIAEARTIAKSILNRIGNIRDAPETFHSLTKKLNLLTRRLATVKENLQTTPDVIPDDLAVAVKETLTSACDTLTHSKLTVEELCLKAFPERGSGSRAKLKSMFRRTFRATDISNTMKDLHQPLTEVSSELLILISMLVTTLKTQKQGDVIVPKLDTLLISGNVEEIYRVGKNTPALPQGAKLNFVAMDADGKHCTPEGILKHSILSSESSGIVTAAAGVNTPAHGVVGMAGVGKTIALQGLAFLSDIRIRFPDGIQYIALGQGASLPTVTGEVAKIMRLTGAKASATAVERSSLLQEAVDYAVEWFTGKICLFLVDDLWPTKDCQTGFLSGLRQLLRSCSESRMAISTRSTIIAHHAGHTVDFAPRAPLGPESVSIFMMHATRDATRKAPQESCGELRKSVARILTICAGLPIALAVTGSTVALMAKEQEDFEGACDVYASQLVKQRIVVGEKQDPEGGSLNAGISLSLKALEVPYVELKKSDGVVTKHTISDLYGSLCVLRNQSWIPVCVLSRMWMVDDDFALEVVLLLGRLSLCKLSFQQAVEGAAKEWGLMLHDLLLDFCKRHAAKLKTSSLWHTQLLNGYLEPVRSISEASLSAEHGASFEDALLQYTPRPWWSLRDDGYMHANLARHLICANLGMELAALLLDSRWTHTRAEIGGILSLESDFEFLLALGGDSIPHTVSLDIEVIWRAIQVSWGRVSEGKRSILLQMCGRLLTLRTDNAIVESYLKSIEAHTPVPYLLPVNPFYPHPLSAQVMEIPVDAECWAVDCSPCGRFIAAGAKNVIVVANAFTGNILKRLKGHSEDVLGVSFFAGSKKLASASEDGSVAVWEWEASASPVRVLSGHSEWVLGLAISNNGGKIFSCSHDCTLRIWDANTGAKIGEFQQKTVVECVAVSNDDQLVAIGLDGGSLKVVDSCTGDTLFEDTNAHKNNVLSVAFNARDELLATGSMDNTIRVWDRTTWMRIGEAFQGHTLGVLSIAFSPDGQQIASASYDGTVRLWDATTGRNVWTSSDMTDYVPCVAFAPDGERIISGGRDGTVRFWDTGREAEANELQYARLAVVLKVAISDNGLLVASASQDGTVSLWNSCTGKQIGRPMQGHTNWVRDVAFSRDGRQAVSGSRDGTVRVWDTETLEQVGDPLEHGVDVRCVSFSSDSLRILSGCEDKTIHIWDAKSRVRIGDTLKGHTGPLRGVSESADGCHIVSKDTDDIVIWRRNERSIVWESKQRPRDSEGATSSNHGSGTRHEMTQEEAERTIRSCGLEAPFLWPKSFPAYTAEAYCRGNSVYSNVPSEGTLLGTLPSFVYGWQYHEARKMLVAAFGNGTIGICNLKM